jgi:hypothetical protein
MRLYVFNYKPYSKTLQTSETSSKPTQDGCCSGGFRFEGIMGQKPTMLNEIFMVFLSPCRSIRGQFLDIGYNTPLRNNIQQLVQCNTNKCLKYSSIFQCGR